VRSGAIKKLNAHIFYQRLDLEAHSRLREIQFLRGLAKAESLRNRPEHHKTKVLKARHSMIKTLAIGAGTVEPLP
jgi:hypothetical protein